MLNDAQKMALKAAVRRDVERSGGQEAATLIPDMRIKRHQTFSEFGSVEHLDRWPTLDVTLALALDSGSSRTIEQLATIAGGLFVPLARFEGMGALTDAMGKSSKEFGDVLVKCADAMSDGKIDDDEKQLLPKEIDEAVTALLTLKAVIERAGE